VNTLPPLDPPEWLLSFDFDGTLSDPDEDPSVRPEFFELIESLRKSDRVFWGVNTGRSLMFTVQGMAEARFPFLPDYLIVREREIYFPNQFGRWIASADWNKKCEKDHRRLFRKHRRFLKKTQQWVESETAAVWGFQAEEPAGIVASTAAEMDGIVRRLAVELLEEAGLSYQRNGIYLRFSHCDYHKGSAMTEIRRLLGLPAERTFAIGDSHNDLDMLDLRLASHLACPGNACEEVKESVAKSGGCLASGHASAGAVEALRAVFSKRDIRDGWQRR